MSYNDVMASIRKKYMVDGENTPTTVKKIKWKKPVRTVINVSQTKTNKSGWAGAEGTFVGPPAWNIPRSPS